MEKQNAVRRQLKCSFSRLVTPSNIKLKLNGSRIFIGLAFFALVCVAGTVGTAADWATYRFDVTRSGVSPETIGPELFLQWKYTPTHSPKPAWPMPAEEMPRMHFDNAYHVAIVDGNVYFGSCVTNKVYSIDVTSGKVNWTFFTQGPVRFAPMVANDRVYVGSDDGYVYCLDARDGKLIWKYRAGPSDEKVIGNGRMISLWPVRTSVLVDNGTAYFGAGVFPYEGIYICALNADDGSVIWRNDTIGDRAHELDYGGIAPHGYLVASEGTLYVPSGRAMPAAFDRKTGKFLFYASPGAKRGGTWTLLDKDNLIAGVDFSGEPQKVAYDAKTGNRKGDAFGWFPGIDMVVTRDVSYVLTLDGIYAINRAVHSEAVKKVNELAKEREKLEEELSELRKKGKGANKKTSKEINEQIDRITGRISKLTTEAKRLRNSSYKWRYSRKGLCTLIKAGNVLYAGGEGLVVGIDAQSGKEVWKGNVSGRAVGFAAAGGRLIVSTNKGPIHCFGEEKVSAAKDIKVAIDPSSYSKDKATKLYVSAAEQIIKETSANKGYCLVLDCGQGRLALELAKRTELKIIGIEKDRKKLTTARKNLEAAGLLGKRVVVEPWDISTLPDYFANLIVSDGMLTSGKTAVSKEEINRVLRPYGGVSLLGSRRFSSREISWDKFVRGKLEGAGSWTQQFGNPQNTACSGDELVNGPLGILWFGEPGPKGMVERHANAASPLSINGRLFIQGEEIIMAVDAYNGTVLWEREIPGAVRVQTKADCGNLVVTEDSLYVAAYDKCYRLDTATGETVRVFKVPQSSDGSGRRWGYVSVQGNILYGSTSEPMDEEYADLWKVAVEDGRWKSVDEVPAQFKDRYNYYKTLYPVPDENLRRTFQRSGTLYRNMTSFARGGEHVQKQAVTRNLMTSDKVFAVDTEAGKLLWEHNGSKIANITVAIGDGKIFLAESTITNEQQKRALQDRRKLIRTGIYKERDGILEELRSKKEQRAELLKANKPSQNRRIDYQISALESALFKADFEEGTLTYDDADVRLVVAVDAATGKKVWEKLVDLTGCCGDNMGAAYSNGMLFFFGNYGNHDAWRFQAGGYRWRRITTLSANNGDVIWSRPLNYRTRPLIVGDKIIIEPLACDLRTGDIIMRNHPITGKQVLWEFLRPGHTCGVTSASTDTLFYRSSCTAFCNIEADRGVVLFGAYRPGCAISVIPASGLLLSPEASAGCTCSYPLRCSLALTRKPKRSQPWTVFITHGATTPAKHFAVNFGAPADMRDNEGTLWFGYPNPKTEYVKNHFPNYGVKFDLHDKLLQGMGYFCSDFKGVNIVGSDNPWLFTSGCLGLLRCELPLIDDSVGQKPDIYTVRLGFNALPKDRPGQRVFDIKLQDQVVLKNFDILQTAGKSNKAIVKEFEGIRAENVLALELVPKLANPQMGQAPIINFIEVVREEAQMQ